jgi:hypothetical protein
MGLSQAEDFVEQRQRRFKDRVLPKRCRKKPYRRIVDVRAECVRTSGGPRRCRNSTCFGARTVEIPAKNLPSRIAISGKIIYVRFLNLARTALTRACIEHFGSDLEDGKFAVWATLIDIPFG